MNTLVTGQMGFVSKAFAAMANKFADLLMKRSHVTVHGLGLAKCARAVGPRAGERSFVIVHDHVFFGRFN